MQGVHIIYYKHNIWQVQVFITGIILEIGNDVGCCIRYLPKAKYPSCGSGAKAIVSKSVSVSTCATTLPLLGVVRQIFPVIERGD